MKYILLTGSDKKDIIRLRKEGVTLHKISEYIGCAISTVRYHLLISKRNNTPCFSTTKDFEAWKENNCYKCKKFATYSERYRRYKKCYCTVKKQLDEENTNVEGLSQRTIKAAKQELCPYFKKNCDT